MSAHGQFSLWPETDDKIKIAYQRGLRGTGFFTIQIEVLAGGSTKEKQRVYILDEIGEQINVELEKKTLTLAITYVVLPTIFAGLVWVLIYVVVLAIVSLLIS